MKRVIVLLAVALAIPAGVALAKGPPQNRGKSAPKVLYILKGTLWGYTAYNSSTNTPGSITILVKRANYHGKALKGQTLTFQGEVVATTKVRLHSRATTITDGDRGIIKIKAAKRIAASDLMTTLTTTPVRRITDQGKAHG